MDVILWFNALTASAVESEVTGDFEAAKFFCDWAMELKFGYYMEE